MLGLGLGILLSRTGGVGALLGDFLLRQGKIGEALLLSMGQYPIGSLRMELPIFAGIARRPIISIWRLSEILEKVS